MMYYNFKIYTHRYTRLPTGHGHCDIDGCFAVLWDKIKNTPLVTVQEYCDAIIQSFDDTLPARVVQVEATLDYTVIYAPHVDKHLARLHKKVSRC